MAPPSASACAGGSCGDGAWTAAAGSCPPPPPPRCTSRRPACRCAAAPAARHADHDVVVVGERHGQRALEARHPKRQLGAERRGEQQRRRRLQSDAAVAGAAAAAARVARRARFRDQRLLQLAARLQRRRQVGLSDVGAALRPCDTVKLTARRTSTLCAAKSRGRAAGSTSDRTRSWARRRRRAATAARGGTAARRARRRSPRAAP